MKDDDAQDDDPCYGCPHLEECWKGRGPKVCPDGFEPESGADSSRKVR